ncbi:hypothetical protein niasHS_004885 [Heterodera schachtii]|uniref:Uncharacterized protein n=1 Tax=Heterodera schachtii TaxID=97005 RepID=A0ABD2JLN7_HETSC
MARWISPRGRPPPAPPPPPRCEISPSRRPPLYRSLILNPSQPRQIQHHPQESSSLSSLSVRLFPHIWSGMARGSSASMCGGSAWIGNAEKRILCAGNAHELKQYVMKSAK